MPQSPAVHTNEIIDHPEHTAAAAAASHNKAPHLSAHEETVASEDHARNAEHEAKLTHGKAASIEAAKGRR